MFLQGISVGRHGLRKPRGPALSRAERVEGGAKILVGCSPAERRPLPGIFLQGASVSRHGLLKPRGPALSLSQSVKGGAKIILGFGPLQGLQISRYCRKTAFLTR